jgi:hypothetical protein
MAEKRKKMAMEDADRIRERARAEGADLLKRGEQFLGKQRAGIGASGLALEEGTSAQGALDYSQGQIKKDYRTLMKRAEDQADRVEDQAEMYDAQAQASMTQGWLGAGSSLATGTAGFLNTYGPMFGWSGYK